MSANKTKLNALAYYANFSINALLMIAISPALVQHLGNDQFGLWKSIQRIIDLASTLDGRGIQSLKAAISRAKQESIASTGPQLIGASVVVWKKFAPILAATAILATLSLPEAIKHTGSLETTYTTGAILALGIILAPLLGIPDGVLFGTNNAYKALSIQTCWVVTLNLSIYIAAQNSCGIATLASLTTVASLLTAATAYLIARKTLPWFKLGTPTEDQNHQILNFSSWSILWALTEKFILSGEILIIGAIYGTAAVADYTFSAYAATFAVAIALFTGAAFTPKLGNLLTHDPIAATRACNNLQNVALAQCTIFATGILCLNQLFVSTWVGQAHYLGRTTDLLVAALMFATATIRNNSQIIDLSLKARKKAITGAILTGSSLLVTYISGAALNLTINETLLILLITRAPLVATYSRQAATTLPSKSESDWKRHLAPLAAMAIIGLTYYIGEATRNWHSESIRSIATHCTTFLVTIALTAYFVLNRDNRSLLRSLINAKAAKS